MQEVIGQKRIVAAGASVPGVAGYLVQTLDQFNARAAAAIGHGDPFNQPCSIWRAAAIRQA